MTMYTDVDRLILDRWDDVTHLLDAREALKLHMGDVVEAAAGRLSEKLKPRNLSAEPVKKEAIFHIVRDSWTARRRGFKVYFELGGFAPVGYCRGVDPDPYIALIAEQTGQNAREKDRLAFAEDLRKALGAAANAWEDEECDAACVLVRKLTPLDSASRRDAISSPEKLSAYALEALTPALEILPIIDECVRLAACR